jgi:hypothetical protein
MSPDSFGVCTTPEVTLNKVMGKQNHHTRPSLVPVMDSKKKEISLPFVGCTVGNFPIPPMWKYI